MKRCDFLQALSYTGLFVALIPQRLRADQDKIVQLALSE